MCEVMAGMLPGAVADANAVINGHGLPDSGLHSVAQLDVLLLLLQLVS